MKDEVKASSPSFFFLFFFLQEPSPLKGERGSQGRFDPSGESMSGHSGQSLSRTQVLRVDPPFWARLGSGLVNLELIVSERRGVGKRERSE